MPKEIMRRKAADNDYLHRDFHGALSEGLNYLEERFGPESVKEYLHRFTRDYTLHLLARSKSEASRRSKNISKRFIRPKEPCSR